MTALVALAMAAIVLGALALYGASPNQLVFAGRRARGWLGWPGGALVVLGTGLLLRWSGPAAAVFTAATLVMLVWTLVPPLAAWRRGDRKAPR